VLCAVYAFHAYLSQPHARLSQVEERMVEFMKEEVLPRVIPDGPPAVIVSHGFAIKWWVMASYLRAVSQ
jgi:hypothetical protein